MTKSLEEWRRDHEIPWDAELKIEVVSWALGDWRSLRAPELKLRAVWRKPYYNIQKWAEFDFDTWQSWVANGCRPPYYMCSVAARRAEKRRIAEQIELYVAAMGIEVAKPTPRRSEHMSPRAMDFSGTPDMAAKLRMVYGADMSSSETEGVWLHTWKPTLDEWEEDPALWKREVNGEWKEVENEDRT